ncbi:glycosyltransferase [Halapricum desulfuricans]|uniref:Glycosyltransferase n=1 Tax=Halapricum desulfuricans TaxID=2841257 RepID=A0A897MSJ4_9EURY|nr:glycosyltransferase [Halapricum desulfuricans]QSG05100.1 Glycosyltransferase [Halapricum desulfuricans]
MASEEPIRITYLINTLGVGGAERGMARLFSGLSPNRFDVTVIGLATRGGGIVDLLPDHVTVIDLGMDSPRDATRLWTVWRELSGTDVLVTSLYHATQVGRVLGTLRRVPVILSWQHNERLDSSLRQRLFGLLSTLDTTVLADSEAAVTGAVESGVPPEKVHRVPIAGIDLDEYEPVSHGPRDTVTVGTVGRLAAQKNMHAVLDVAASLQNEPLEFRIAGEGPQRDELEKRIRAESIDNVTLEGFVDSVPHFLSGLDVYFQPSVREGLCVTVVEAMAAGLPVVGSAVGGITETVVPGETGMLEEPSSTDAFVDDILELSTDYEMRATYGTAGRERVAEHYSRERLVKEFLEVVEQNVPNSRI